MLNFGTVVDDLGNKLLGFWDLLEKPTILLTATMDYGMEDLMFEMYGISRQKFYSFDELYAKNEKVLP